MSNTNKRWSMKLGATAAALGVLSAAFAALPPSASAMAMLPGNVAPWLAQARLLGHASTTGRITVSVYLGWRHETQLQAMIRRLYTPGSTQYHHFLTAAQFHAAFAPSGAQLQAVRHWLQENSLSVGASPADGLYVDATGTVAQVERAFHVTENRYLYQGKTLRANAQAPTVPARLAGTVTGIGGLDEGEALVKPASPDAPPGAGYSTPGPCSTYWSDHSGTVNPPAYQYGSTLPWVVCGYTPSQIRAAYGVDKTGLTGAGVRIGIVDAYASTTILQDVNRYSAHYGLPTMTSSTLQQVVAPGTYNKPENPKNDPQGWFGEETLDVEIAHTMAPGATIVYAGAQNNNVPLDHALVDMIDRHLADVISNSWGYDGEYGNYGHLQDVEKALQQAAATGISVLFSSGDYGDVAAIRGEAMASYPASSAWATAVGGTSLALRDASGSKSEWGWGTYGSTLSGSAPTQTSLTVTGTAWSPWPPTFLSGSGGGVSLLFAQPWYQAGVVPAALSTSTTTANGQTVTFSSPHRVVPDIAMDADPNTGLLVGETYAVSGDSFVDQGCTPLGGGYEYCERRIGGTSLASPMFAGVVALANQARLTAGEGTIGFLNPVLYQQTPIGSPGSHAAIEDILPPSAPTAVLRNYEGTSPTGLVTKLRTINSVPASADGPVIEGADTSLRTTAGYDDVTGLGAPYAPSFVSALVAAHAYHP